MFEVVFRNTFFSIIVIFVIYLLLLNLNYKIFVEIIVIWSFFLDHHQQGAYQTTPGTSWQLGPL